jgi:predicted glycosyltransferase
VSKAAIRRERNPARGDPVPRATPRIALYSHDALGLGHMRRNLAIAEVLGQPGSSPVLLLTGAREVSRFTMPRGIDCVALPAFRKGADRRYRPRSLSIPYADLLELRSQAIRAALDSFAPDVLIVDKLAFGLGAELKRALASLRERGRTRFVLGLRDVLDERATALQEWRHAATDAAIRNYYDAVWVYGDPRVYDPVVEYRLSGDVAAKVRYTGYLSRHPGLGPDGDTVRERLALPPGELALCLVGGGEDGGDVARAFARAKLPDGMNGVIVAGPFMPPAALSELVSLTADRERMRLLGFIEDPSALMGAADRVVAMGGYNTICELLSLEKPALIVPRVKTRREQLVRAERFAELGLVDVLRPDDLSASSVGAWLRAEIAPPARVAKRVDLNGLERLPDLLDEVLASPRPSNRRPARDGRPVAVNGNRSP